MTHPDVVVTYISHDLFYSCHHMISHMEVDFFVHAHFYFVFTGDSKQAYKWFDSNTLWIKYKVTVSILTIVLLVVILVNTKWCEKKPKNYPK